MKPIWGELNTYTWDELRQYRWEDFRLALMETSTELEVQGVRIENTGAVNEIITELNVQGVRVEFSPVIMEQETEMSVGFVVTERDYLSEMLSYLPSYERKSSVIIETLGAYDMGFSELEHMLNISERNLFVDTAVEALPIFEKDLGLTPQNELDYEQRRQQIISRFRASLEQTTEETIKNVAKAFKNGEIEINKTDTPGVFEIKFTGFGIPDNLEGFKRVIDIIMPAHLQIEYTFIFNTWDVVSNVTWDQASNMTWEEFREWDEVS